MFQKKKYLRDFEKYFLMTLSLVLLSINMYAAWRSDIPTMLIQPDDTEIEAFISGDEFYNWVHDEE